METKDPIDQLREHARKVSDMAAEFSDRGFSPLGFQLEALANEIAAQYMKLPVDADGVPIRPGDRVEGYEQTDVRVEGIANGGVIVRSNVPGGHGYPDTSYPLLLWANGKVRHVKPDTVESILEEFAVKYEQVNNAPLPKVGFGNEIIGEEELSDVIAGYAERIRKAVHDGD